MKLDFEAWDPTNKDLSDEELWSGVFGVQYTTKFYVDWRERIPFMKKILERTGAKEILDVGTNAGWNLRAIRSADIDTKIEGLEINEHVAITAASMGFIVHVGAARFVGGNFPLGYDLVITSGVLIHVPPNQLEQTMKSIFGASREWVLAIEYAAEEEKVIRSHDEVPRTWARPYGQLYQNLGLELVEHGKDEAYPECEYWLLRKRT